MSATLAHPALSPARAQATLPTRKTEFAVDAEAQICALGAGILELLAPSLTWALPRTPASPVGAGALWAVMTRWVLEPAPSVMLL
jgi:hypothetical protein